jgi:hypothetical protein
MGGAGLAVALAVVGLGYLVTRGSNPPLERPVPDDVSAPRKAPERRGAPTLPPAARSAARPAPASRASAAAAPAPAPAGDLAAEIEAILREYDRIVADVPLGPNDADRIASLRERAQKLDKLVERLAALGPGAVPLLAALLRGGDASRADVVGHQTLAIRALSRIPGKEALSALGDALAAVESFTLKMTIVAQLAENGGRDGTDILADRLGAEQDPRVRSRILNYLGQQKDARALMTVTRAATDDADPNVRIAAIRALGEAADPSTGPVLERIARTNEDIACRQNAIQIYARLAKDQATPLLEDLLRNDQNLRIKAVAVLGLQEVGGERSRAILESVANDPSASEEVRARARGAVALLDRQGQQGGVEIGVERKIEGMKPINVGGLKPITPLGEKR